MPAEVPITVANILANMLMRAKRAAAKPHTDVGARITADQQFADEGAISIGRGPVGDIATEADAIVVTHHGDRSVTLVDPNTLTVTNTVGVSGEPFAVAVADGRAYISTASTGVDAVAVLDTSSHAVIANYPVAFSVTALTVSPDGKRVFVGRRGEHQADIAVIDVTAERLGTIDLAQGPGVSVDALRVDATGTRLYVAASDDRTGQLIVVNIETARVETAVTVGSPIRDLALSADSAYVLTSDRVRGGAVAVIDLGSLTLTGLIDLGGAPTQLVLSPDATRAYVVDYDHIGVLCTLTNQLINRIEIGTRPSGVALSADGGKLFAADYQGDVTTFAVASTLPAGFYAEIETEKIAAASALAAV